MKPKQVSMTVLAKDILYWLRTPAMAPIEPATGETYLKIPNSYLDFLRWRTAGSRSLTDETTLDVQDVQDALKKNLGQCTVCAIGAFVAAKAFRVDSFQIRGRCAGRLQCIEFLGERRSNMLRKIEAAFENCDGLPRRFLNKTAVQRLRFICKNIIENKGRFVSCEW